MPNIEDTVCEDTLPVNSKAMLKRLNELLDEHQTNSLQHEEVRRDKRVQKVVWLLNQQMFGQLATIKMDKEWDCLCDGLGKDEDYCKRRIR